MASITGQLGSCQQQQRRGTYRRCKFTQGYFFALTLELEHVGITRSRRTVASNDSAAALTSRSFSSFHVQPSKHRESPTGASFSCNICRSASWGTRSSTCASRSRARSRIGSNALAHSSLVGCGLCTGAVRRRGGLRRGSMCYLIFSTTCLSLVGIRRYEYFGAGVELRVAADVGGIRVLGTGVGLGRGGARSLAGGCHGCWLTVQE